MCWKYSLCLRLKMPKHNGIPVFRRTTASFPTRTVPALLRSHREECLSPHLTAHCPVVFAGPPAGGCNLLKLSQDHSSAAENRRKRLGWSPCAYWGTWGRTTPICPKSTASSKTLSISRHSKLWYVGTPYRPCAHPHGGQHVRPM